MGKLSTYPLATPVDGDKFPFTDDPAGIPVTKNVLAEALAAYIKTKLTAYGGLFIADDVGGPQVVSTTPAVIEGFNNLMATFGGVTAAVEPANTITVTEAGNYFITGAVSYLGENNKTYTVEMFVNGVPTGAHLVRTVGSTTAETGGGYAAIVALPAGAVLDLRVSSPTGVSITITDCQFMVEKR